MKHNHLFFILLCLLLCLIPSVGMLFFPTTQTTENRAMAEPPRLVSQEGILNRGFFSDFEAYFNEHAALRNQLVYTDALLQTTVFHQSNVSGVIAGTDGWLYYASTLADYLGTDPLSDRDIWNLANNLQIVSQYLEARQVDFVFTIAPNKNSLYDEHMPYYASHIADPRRNAQRLAPELAQLEVPYLDLFAAFEAQDEVLYLLRDSHWNNKGACLAYNAIMDSLQLPHATYDQTEPRVTHTELGDLNKMLYSFYGQPEPNYDYGLTQTYTFDKEGATVEDGWLVSRNPAGSGTLLMFRDSFANTLIPFLSNEFQTACYSKGEPHALERYLQNAQPDCVVIEKVERNIANYLEQPPILTAEPVTLPHRITVAETASTAAIDTCLNDTNYYTLSGTVDPARIQTESRILVSVNGRLCHAYQSGDSDFLLYLPKAALTDPEAQVLVYVLTQDRCVQVLRQTLSLPR